MNLLDRPGLSDTIERSPKLTDENAMTNSSKRSGHGDTRHLSADAVRRMLKDYGDRSLTLQMIQCRYGVSSTRIYEELQKAGLPRRARSHSFKDDLTVETLEKITDAYTSNMPVDQIATDFGLNYDQVYVLVREGKLPPRSSDRRNGDDPEFRERLAHYYGDKTLSVVEVASKLNISVKTLTRMVSRFDLPRRGRGGGLRGTPDSVLTRLEEIKGRIEGGESAADIAAELGIGVSTLRQKLRDAFRQ
jgi:transposase